MKTLANCSPAEFLPAAYKTRRLFHQFYELIDMDSLRARAAKQLEGAEPDDKPRIMREFFESVLFEMLERHPAETIEIAGALALKESGEGLEPLEILQILTEAITSERILDFFISLEALAGNSTGGIWQMLMLLKLIASATSTSQTASENSTNGTAEPSPAGAMSENASAP